MAAKIKAYASPRIEALARQLASTLKQNSDPLRSPLILVPNGNLRKWLTLELARVNGCAAGLDIRFLETGLVARLFGEEAAPLTDEALALLIDAALADPGPSPELEPLLGYCNPAGGADPARRWQLACRLAVLFRDYGLHRHEYTTRWLEGSDAFGTVDDGISRAQAALYRRIFAPYGLLSRVNRARAASDRDEAQLFSIFASTLASPACDLPIHVFGFSSLSPRHLAALANLAADVEVVLYFLSPENSVVPSDVPADVAADAPALAGARRHWGRAANGTTALLREIPGLETTLLPWTGTPHSLLEAVQDALSTGNVPDGDFTDDGSVRITGCPGVYREVETACDDIIAAMETDPSLELTDIAVLTTDIQAYLPALLSVFEGRETGGRKLAFNLSDTSAREESIYGRALLELFALADGELSRRAVFTLARNQAVQAGRGIGEATAETWGAWAGGLQVFRGAAGGGKSWGFGLERLRLGQIMNALDEHPAGLAGRFPWRDHGSDDAAAVAAFSSFVDDLARFQKRLQGGPRDAATWKGIVEDMMETFLAIPPDRLPEAAVRAGIEAALDTLILADQAAVSGKAALAPGVVRDFLDRKLAGIPVTRGQYLTGGVTVSSLIPLRPVPFKRIWILGLQEGRFPGTAEDNILDLRAREGRRASDITTPELKQALFLETVFCTRERLSLSYVNRDLQKDREFFPCSVVNRLQALLGECFPAVALPVAAAPLKGYSVRFLDHARPDHFSPPSYNPQERLLCLARLAAHGRLAAAPDPAVLAEYRRREPGRLTEEAGTGDDGEISISLYQLYDFLRNPARARIRRRIRAKINPGTDAALEDYPALFTGCEVRDPLFTVLVETLFAGKDPLPHLADCHARLLAARQMVPDGVFRSLDWKAQEEHFLRILEGEGAGNGLRAYHEGTAGMLGPPQPARLCGRTQRAAEGVFDIHLKTLELADGRCVRLTGGQDWLRRSPDGTAWELLCREYSACKEPTPTILQPLLFSSITAALAETACTTAGTALVSTRKTERIPLLTDATLCRTFLTGLVEDYLAGGEPAAFPIKGISALLWRGAPKIGRSKRITPAYINSLADGFRERLQEFLDGEDDAHATGMDEYAELTEARVPATAGDLLLRRILPLYRMQQQQQQQEDGDD